VTIRPQGAGAAPAAGTPAPNGGNGAAGVVPNLPQGQAGAQGAAACSCNCLCPAGSFNLGALPAMGAMPPPPGPPPPGAATTTPQSVVASQAAPPPAAAPTTLATVPAVSPLAAMLPPPAGASGAPSLAPNANSGIQAQAEITVAGSVISLQSAVTAPLIRRRRL
jgi:hypothetical protein